MPALGLELELRKCLEGFINTKNVDAPNGCLICKPMIEETHHTAPVFRAIKCDRDLVTKAPAKGRGHRVFRDAVVRRPGA